MFNLAAMVSVSSFCRMALSFPQAEEQPHFHLRSFRVKKKIFTTLHEKDNRVMVKLPVMDQSVFCAFDSAVIYPVPGTWGRQGATFIELKTIRPAMLKDALTVAWCAIAPPALLKEFLKGRG